MGFLSNKIWVRIFLGHPVIALYVQFACQFGLTGITLHLRSPLHCRAFVTTFGLITIGSSTLSNVNHSSMLLVINMTVAGRQMSYSMSPHTRNGCVITGVPNLSLTMYPFSILMDEYVR